MAEKKERPIKVIAENRKARFNYAIEDTVRTVLQSNLPEPAKGLLVEVFRTGGMAKPDSGKQKADGFSKEGSL